MLSPLILQTTLIITESHILSDKSDHTSSHPVVGGAGGEGEEDGQTIYNLDSSRSPRAESCPSIGCLPHCLTASLFIQNITLSLLITNIPDITAMTQMLLLCIPCYG